jgi:hypothetical protein
LLEFRNKARRQQRSPVPVGMTKLGPDTCNDARFAMREDNSLSAASSH